jgi:hypothetical protein
MLRAVCMSLFSLMATSCAYENWDLFLPVVEKVTKAFPPKAEVRVAMEDLRTLIQQDQETLKSIEAEYSSRLEQRAFICTKEKAIGRFDSVEKIKAIPSVRDCFNLQDALLLQYLGIRLVAPQLSKPPLRPLAPLGPPFAVPDIETLQVFSGFAASGAGVAVLKGTRNEFISIEIPSGKKIADMSTIANAWNDVFISPNGHVAAIDLDLRNRAVVFVDTETGAKFWEARDSNKFYAWLPEMSAALVSDSKTSVLSVIDFHAAKIEPYNVNLRNQSWVLPLDGSPSRVLVGSHRAFSLIEHERTPEGIKGSVIKEFIIKQGQGVTSSPPTLMFGGKAIVFISSRDFMMVNLETGEETFWATGQFISNHYAKLSENTLLVDSFNQGGKPWVFNIEQSTLSPVETEAGNHGIIAELPGRIGFMRRESKMWFGDKLKSGAPVSLDSWIENFKIERQKAEIQSKTPAIDTSTWVGLRPSKELVSSAEEGKAADSALEKAVYKKILRRASVKDAEEWTESLKRKYAKSKFPPPDIAPDLINAYVVLKEFTCPDGLYGAHAATFYVPLNVFPPKGKCGHSKVYDLNTMMLECSAASPCGKAMMNGSIGAGSTQRQISIDSGNK